MPTAPYPLLQQQARSAPPPRRPGFYSREETWREKLANVLTGFVPNDRFRFQKAKELLGEDSPFNPVGMPFNFQEAAQNKDALGVLANLPGTGMLEGPAVKYGVPIISGVAAAKLGEKFITPKTAKKFANQLNVMFGPLHATDKELKALDVAKDMKQSGRTPEDVWQQKHWAEINPGDWVSEMPDNPHALTVPPQGGDALENVYNEPAYFERNPEVRRVRTGRLHGAPPELGGRYTFEGPGIQINTKNIPSKQRESFYHELEHMRAHQHGKPTGSSGSQEYAYPGGPGWEAFLKKLDELGGGDINDFEHPVVRQARRFTNRDMYWRDPGEHAAREAGRRQTWDWRTRQAIPPGSPLSGDVPRELISPSGIIRPWKGVTNPFQEWQSPFSW